MENIFETVGKIVIEELTEKKVLDHRVLRNIKIREQYKRLRSQGKTKSEALEVISETPFFTPNGEKYYVGTRGIEKVVYSGNEKD